MRSVGLEIQPLLSTVVGFAIIINALTGAILFYYLRGMRPKKNAIDHPQTSKEPNEEPSKEQILARRLAIIHEIEEQRGTKVVSLINRVEPWSKSSNEPEMTIDDSEAVLERIQQTPPDKPIDFILHTSGGLRFAAHLIAMSLKNHKAKVTVIVPFYALSNGTLLALAGDEIMMEKYSVLGSIEPQLTGMPASSIMSVTKRKPPEDLSDFIVLLADLARMETDNAIGFVRWLLEDKMNKDQVEQIANFLVRGGTSVSTPITLDVVRAMGLKVSDVPEKIYELFATMEFGGQRPGSEFR